MIGSVSFSSTQGTNFQDLINKPQAYTASSTPNAASGVSDSFEKKKPSAAKKVGMFVGIAAAVAGALALGHKTGVTKSIPKVGAYLDKAGAQVTKLAKAAVTKAQDGIATIKEKFSHKEFFDGADDLVEDFVGVSDNVPNDFKDLAKDAVENLDEISYDAAMKSPVKSNKIIDFVANKILHRTTK